eukprot:jgi/Pico_ML_1/55790/g1428.t1
MVFRRLLQDLSHDKEIIPLLSMVGVALSAMTYTMYRTATKNPDVRFIKVVSGYSSFLGASSSVFLNLLQQSPPYWPQNRIAEAVHGRWS